MAILLIFFFHCTWSNSVAFLALKAETRGKNTTNRRRTLTHPATVEAVGRFPLRTLYDVITVYHHTHTHTRNTQNMYQNHPFSVDGGLCSHFWGQRKKPSVSDGGRVSSLRRPIMGACEMRLPVMGKRRSCCPHIPGLHGSVWTARGIPWRLPVSRGGGAG